MSLLKSFTRKPLHIFLGANKSSEIVLLESSSFWKCCILDSKVIVLLEGLSTVIRLQYLKLYTFMIRTFNLSLKISTVQKLYLNVFFNFKRIFKYKSPFYSNFYHTQYIYVKPFKEQTYCNT